MDKKLLIGLLVVAGIVIGYQFINRKPSVSAKKESDAKKVVTEKDGYDFYNLYSKDSGLVYSDEGIGRFIKAYPQIVTGEKHIKLMNILSKSKESRTSEELKMITDLINEITQKIK